MDARGSTAEAGGATLPATVRVWDPFVRIFHWSLVALFAFAFLTGDEWDKPHEIAGYTIAGLIALRVVWGFIGTKHARFTNFVTGPGTAIGYVKDAVSFRAKRHLGHNPAGAVMVIALLLAISAICATGYMMETDTFWGVDWVEEVHEFAANATLVLIALHIGGVVFASIEHGENLVRAMVTGNKRA
ncbi:MAG: cytochrome b/b6 domain-containing protein [Tepidamorphaceae bacterium]|nr:cytochrome b/b6 domain-containing protein [Rhodobiaceae bacterium]MCC0048552.1 cytochrome b/b6 domain-containing protein [Rhodobiaceae bacterium]